VDLQAIIHIPGTDDFPITLCHTSLCDLLTDESRSGSFFALPSYRLNMSYLGFTAAMPDPSRPDKKPNEDLFATKYATAHFAQHWSAVLEMYDASKNGIHKFLTQATQPQRFFVFFHVCPLHWSRRSSAIPRSVYADRMLQTIGAGSCRRLSRYCQEMVVHTSERYVYGPWPLREAY
jgi:hypothetical protein